MKGASSRRNQTTTTTGVAPDRLVEIVNGFEGLAVVVLGDLVCDEFVYGDIARISREAPVMILEQRRVELVPGGGANAVANLQALGARPIPVGVVGEDDTGRRLVTDLRGRGIDVDAIVAAPRYCTPTKSRILAGGVHTRRQQLVRLDRGSSRLPDRLGADLDRAARTALRDASGLLVADYGFGVATPDRVHPILARLRRQPTAVTVDSRGRVGEYRGVSACTPNQEELERALEIPPLDDEDALLAAGRRLLRRTRNDAVLVTRGALGMCLFERGRAAVSIPAHGSDEVADVTGAGDTVIAVFTLARLAGAAFVDAARLANYAAGLVVMKAGTATLTVDELVKAIVEDTESR